MGKNKIISLSIIVLLIASVTTVISMPARSQVDSGMIGSGTEEDPYMIENVEHLQNMSANLSANYELANDIDASETDNWNDGKGFSPVGNTINAFNGSLDGRGYGINGLYIDRSDENHVGLISYMNRNATFTNVSINNADINGKKTVGSAVGMNFGGLIHNSHASGNVAGDNYTGGLIGANYGTLMDSSAVVDVNGSNNTGGLSGGNDGTISNSESSGSVTGEWSVGGLVGWNKRSIENSHSDSEVFGDNVVGGLIGWNYYFSSSVKGSYSIGEVNGAENVSAFVGWNDRGVVENCYVDGTVEGEKNVGGLVGWNRGVVSYSYATGSVEGVKSTGGLVGWNNNTVENSYASNTVNGNDNVGGIAGTNNGTISVSYSTGDVNGINSTGGLVGWNYDAEIMNSYSTGNVDGELDVGGLVGWNSNIIEKSFSVGTVVGNNNIGGLVGTNRGEVEDSFWDNQTSDQNESDGGTGKNTTMMKNVTTFTDTNTIGLNESWDFVGDPYDDTGDANIWYIDEEKQINHGYPFLTWEVDSVDIQPSDNATIEAGTAIDFEAMAYHWNGSLITDETTGFTWENTTEEGTFEITTAGIYTVRATYVWKTSDEVTVSVEPSDVSEVEIMPRGDQTVQIDESIDFDCWANDTYGNTITDDDTEFTWSNTDDEGIFEESVPGDYEVTAGYLGVISDPLSVTVRGPLFEFSNIRLDPKEPQVGEEVRLMVNVTNVGNDVGEYTVEFYINEEEVGSDTVNVEAGETKVASVNYTLNRADNHTLEAEGQSIYFNSYDDTSESSSYWWLLILILIILVIAVAVALYMNQKGKSDGRHSSKKTKKVKRVKNEPSGDEDY